jgi:hypothetical protein
MLIPLLNSHRGGDEQRIENVNCKHQVERLFVRHRLIWECNIKMDLK